MSVLQTRCGWWYGPGHKGRASPRCRTGAYYYAPMHMHKGTCFAWILSSSRHSATCTCLHVYGIGRAYGMY